MEMVISILAAAVRSGTPILFATLGEIIIEKSGILNLGLEGIMLIGALTGFSVSLASGNPWLGIIAAFILGAFITLIHGFISITLKGNQVVSGLAMTIFGTGVSSLIGKAFIGKTIPGLLKTPFPLIIVQVVVPLRKFYPFFVEPTYSPFE